MAHVRVAVVHHLQVRRGIRRNQRAGSASVPLKGGGGILAFPLRGGVPHVRPQVKLVPGADRPVLVRRVAVLGRVRTQPYVRRIAAKFFRKFFLGKHNVEVFLKTAEFRIRQQTGRNQRDVVVNVTQILQTSVFIVGQQRIKRDKLSDCGHVVPGSRRHYGRKIERLQIGAGRIPGGTQHRQGIRTFFRSMRHQIDTRFLVFPRDPPGYIFTGVSILFQSCGLGGIIYAHHAGVDFLFILIPGSNGCPYRAWSHQGDAAEVLVRERTFAQQVFTRFQRTEPAQIRVGNEPAAEHGFSSCIIGGRDVHTLGVIRIEPGIPAVPDTQNIRGVSFAGSGRKNAGIGGNTLVRAQFTLKLAQSYFQGKSGEGFGLRRKKLFLGNTDL